MNGISLYLKRRRNLLKKISKGKGNKIAIIRNNVPVRRNGCDGDYPFRDDSNFWYLTGFSEPGAVLVLVADENPRSILFCEPERDFDTASFYGETIGPAKAVSEFGFDESYSVKELQSNVLELFKKSDTLYCLLGQNTEWDKKILGWISEGKSRAYRKARPPLTRVEDLETILSEMRLIKDENEIGLLSKACDITKAGICAAMRNRYHGMGEYELEAIILYAFRINGGASLPAFPCIVACGANATTLHYDKNDAVLKNGELVQLDIGAEYKNYSGDISRVFPVTGKFSRAQRAVYEIVLEAQKKAIKEVRVGKAFTDPHDAAVRVITEGLVRLGLLHGNADELIAAGKDPEQPPKNSYKRFFMHRTGHWLGLDTHDVGSYYNQDGTSRTLKKGMVLTVEPGIYIKPADDVPEQYWNIGIRIEDDVLVTSEGPKVLSGDIPKEIAEIERLCNQ